MFEWFSRFKRGETLIDDKPRSGRSFTIQTDENVEKIGTIILEDRRRTVEEDEEGAVWNDLEFSSVNCNGRFEEEKGGR